MKGNELLPEENFPKAFSQKGKRLLPGIFAKGLALWVKADKALVIADLHLGIEEMFNRQGMMLPRFNFSEIRKHLEKKVFPGTKPELIVINGDFKHEFGIVSEQEWSEVIDMLRLLQKHCKKIVLVRGNHDKVLGPIAKWEGLGIEKGGVLLPKSLAFVTHGREMPKGAEFGKAKVVIIGHDHPAVTIREQYKSERYKCFLVGKFGKKKLVAMPSMSMVSIGSDVKGKLLSPFLQKGIEKFRVFAVADKTYDFGPLEGLD
ncbi:MAG: metallophosphoesterase [archaeon]